MSKNIPITLLLALLVAIVALFAVTEVMAQERPDECKASGSTYTLSLADGFPVNLDATRWQWRYNITCASANACAKINKVVGYLPSLPPNVIQLFSSGDFDIFVNSRGAGDSSTKMGAAITNGITFTITPVEGGNNSTGIIEFLTDVGSSGLMSVGFNTGQNKLEGCFAENLDGQGPVGGIIGPGFDQAAIVRPGTALSRIIPLDENNCIKVFLDPVTLCASEVEWWKNATCEGDSSGTIPEEEDPEPIAIFAGTGNQFCPEGFRLIDVPGFSPCYEYVSGGRTRYIPAGCR